MCQTEYSKVVISNKQNDVEIVKRLCVPMNTGDDLPLVVLDTTWWNGQQGLTSIWLCSFPGIWTS